MSANNSLRDRLADDEDEVEDLMEEHGILRQLIARLVERGLEIDLAERLRYALAEPERSSAVNIGCVNKHRFKNRSCGLPSALPRLRYRGLGPPITLQYPMGTKSYGNKFVPGSARLMKAPDIQAVKTEANRILNPAAPVFSIKRAVIGSGVYKPHHS